MGKPWVPGQRKKHGEGKSHWIGEMFGVKPKTVRDIWNHRFVIVPFCIILFLLISLLPQSRKYESLWSHKAFAECMLNTFKHAQSHIRTDRSLTSANDSTDTFCYIPTKQDMGSCNKTLVGRGSDTFPRLHLG